MTEGYVGEIKIFAGRFAPEGWAKCDGSLVSKDQYKVLFGLIGTTYGTDGQTKFALPDLRGRMPVHIGQGAGLSKYELGEKGGTEKVTLTTAQIPQHKHTPVASKAPGDSDKCAGNYWAKSATTTQFAPPDASLVSMDSKAISATGEDQAHDNMLPFIALNFIIALG